MIALGLVTVLASAAHAQSIDPHERARELFEEGVTAYDQGDLTTAERLFRASLAMRSSGAALFNLARLLDGRGQTGEALELYEQLEAMEGLPPDVARITRERLAALRAADPPAPTPEPEPEPEPEPSPPPEPPPSSGPSVVGPAILLGAAGAVLIAGTITGAIATAWHGQLLDACPDGVCTEPRDLARADEGRSLSLVTDVLLPVGAAIGVAGAIWLIVALGESDDVRARGDRLEVAF